MRTSFVPAVLASALLATLATGCVSPNPETPTSAGEGAIGTFTSDAAGFDTHSFYYDTGKEVVVFDAQFTPTLAKKVIDQIHGQTSSPITYLVVLHPNPDKFNGAPEFQKIGAKVVASQATTKAIPGVHAYKKYYFVNVAKMFTDETYPAEAKVDVTFQGHYSLPLSAGAVELSELSSAGVSSTQTVAWVPSQKALFVGDLVHHEAHAWLEGGIVNGKATPDLPGWRKDLAELSAFEGATVFGGRGEAAPVEEAVPAQLAYLDGMEKLVTDYVAQLGAAKSELSGEKAGAHYKAIAGLAAKRFPDDKLPYLVEYGVYGLVNQIAAK
jgi:glyoxylase-like metal-dependent hydrolase (beta-lactamase superfamily II)